MEHAGRLFRELLLETMRGIPSPIELCLDHVANDGSSYKPSFDKKVQLQAGKRSK